EDPVFPGDDFRGRTDLQARRDTVLNIGVAGFADRRDAAIANADVRLHNSPMIEDDRICDDEVRRARRTGGLRLPLTVTNDLAAAEHDLIAVASKVLFD